jgi:hypothetical protein
MRRELMQRHHRSRHFFPSQHFIFFEGKKSILTVLFTPPSLLVALGRFPSGSRRLLPDLGRRQPPSVTNHRLWGSSCEPTAVVRRHQSSRADNRLQEAVIRCRVPALFIA